MPETTRTTIYLKKQDRDRLDRIKKNYGLGTSAAVRAALYLLEKRMEMVWENSEHVDRD